MSAARIALATGILGAAPLVMGCGLLLDGVYLIGNKRYNETVQERKPTGQVITQVEYPARVDPTGKPHLACEERERRIERSFSVEKTWEHRGGWDASTYVATAALSGVIAAVTAGALTGICLHTPEPGHKRVSCYNILYATPFAVDVIYSVIRAKTAKPSKLVDKHTNEASLALAETPSRSTPVDCAANVQQVMLGALVGPSDVDALNGRGGGEKAHLADGAIPVALGPDGTLSLADQPAVAHAWAKNDSLALWVVDREGAPRRWEVDRCAVMRPITPMLVGDELMWFLKTCPVSPPPQPR